MKVIEEEISKKVITYLLNLIFWRKISYWKRRQTFPSFFHSSLRKYSFNFYTHFFNPLTYLFQREIVEEFIAMHLHCGMKVIEEEISKKVITYLLSLIFWRKISYWKRRQTFPSFFHSSLRKYSFTRKRLILSLSYFFPPN